MDGEICVSDNIMNDFIQRFMATFNSFHGERAVKDRWKYLQTKYHPIVTQWLIKSWPTLKPSIEEFLAQSSPWETREMLEYLARLTMEVRWLKINGQAVPTQAIADQYGIYAIPYENPYQLLVGQANITVYIWEPQGNSVGHAALGMGDGTYVSFHPNNPKLRVAEFKQGVPTTMYDSYEDEIAERIEANEKDPRVKIYPDHIEKLHNLNEIAMRHLWLDIRPLPYKVVDFNCSTVVAFILIIGMTLDEEEYELLRKNWQKAHSNQLQYHNPLRVLDLVLTLKEGERDWKRKNK